MSILIKNTILNNKKTDILIKENKITLIKENILEDVDEIIDCQFKKAVFPGFINCHTHLAMSLLKGYADDLSLSEWLFDNIFKVEEELTEEDIYWGTKLACLELIKSGVTCVNEMYLFMGLKETVRAVEEMGIRGVIGICFTDGSFENVKNYCEKISFKKTALIKYAIAPHAIYTVSKEGLIWAKEFADKNDLLIHMHLAETREEIVNCKKEHGFFPVQYLDSIGFLNSNCLFAHSIWINEEGLGILKERDCNLIYNPCSNMKLASGIFKFKDIFNLGINITLGTDGSASNNNLNMFEEMKIGSLLQKVNYMDPTICKANEMIDIATKNGAKALKINSGEIREGALADLILIDLEKFNPSYNIISDLVYSAREDCVSDVICNGRFLMKNRIVEGEEEILKNVKSIVNKFIDKKNTNC